MSLTIDAFDQLNSKRVHHSYYGSLAVGQCPVPYLLPRSLPSRLSHCLLVTEKKYVGFPN